MADRLRGQNLLDDHRIDAGNIGRWIFAGAGAGLAFGPDYVALTKPAASAGDCVVYHARAVEVKPHDTIEFGCTMRRSSGGAGRSVFPSLYTYDPTDALLVTVLGPVNVVPDDTPGFQMRQYIIPLGVKFVRPGMLIAGGVDGLDTVASMLDCHCVLL